MKELIPIKNEGDKQVISARDLYNFLGCTERFQSWFNRHIQYGFIEDEDFTSVKSFTLVNNGAKREVDDYAITIDMAKEISMLQRSEKGKEARAYFIKCEKELREIRNKSIPDFNDKIAMANFIIKQSQDFIASEQARQRAELALVESNKQLEAAKEENKVAIETIKEAKPCVEFYSQYQESDGFLVRELSKFLELFGIIISRKNLYSYLTYIGFIFKKDPENGRWEPYASAQKQGFIYYASDKGDEFFKANPKAVKITVKGINFLINSIRRNEKIFLGFGSLKPNFDSRVNTSDILNKIRTFVEKD